MRATVSRVILLQQLLVVQKRTKSRREGSGKTKKDSQPNFLKLSCDIKQSLLFRTHPLASLSLHNDHRSDGRQCAQTPFPPSNQRSTTKEGGWKFFLGPNLPFLAIFLVITENKNRTLFFYFLLFTFHKKFHYKTTFF